VLLAGKGHEDYQIFADRTIHFDDREEARNALVDRGYGVAGS
jgi:UDP-N-acetylmuramoyl-L-alanyl-D-glutamate--2,6-diaminopimelate ligase